MKLSLLKSTILCLLAILILAGIKDSISKLYVKFGAAKIELNNANPNNVIRLFFDRYGYLYPNYPIDDKIIQINDSRLEVVFKNNPDLYKDICQSESPDNPLLNSCNNHDTDKDPLQHTLINKAINSINKNAIDRKLIFIIHGFNKHPLLPENGSSSYENLILRNEIQKEFPVDSFLFVEIYWDGCSQVNGTQTILESSYNTFKIWDNAQAASNYIGLELRRILYGISANNIYIVTHSLGASVITTALFNVEKFRDSRYMREIIELYDDKNIYSTPTKQFSVGMLAPAIPGENTFDDYYKRTPALNDSINNFRFIIGFNSNDEVLRKFINLDRNLGVTSLGCRMDDLQKCENMLNNNGENIITHVNFSQYNSNLIHKNHPFKTYVHHRGKINQFLNSVIR